MLFLNIPDRDAMLAERESLRSELAHHHSHVAGLAEDIHIAQIHREQCRLLLEAADRAEPDADTPTVLVT